MIADAFWGIRFSTTDRRLHFNTKLETLEKRFPSARRVLVPVECFELIGGKDGDHPRPHHEVRGLESILLAGMSNDPLDGPITRVSVLTRASRGAVASIYHRTPVVIPVELARTWVVGGGSRTLVNHLLEAEETLIVGMGAPPARREQAFPAPRNAGLPSSSV